MTRYRNIFFLLLGIGLAAGAAELVFHVFLPQYSITQRSGPGQIALYGIGLVAIFWFTVSVARINPAAFSIGYLRDWRRLIAGFAVMFVVAMLAMLMMHLIMGQVGTARFSADAWQAMTLKVWERTAVALLVVVVLAATEEAIFRGFLLRYLRWNDSLAVTVAAVVVSSVIFSLLHVIALQSAIRQPDYVPLLFGLFLFGLLLGTVYVTTGSLACSIGMHAGLLGFKVIQRKTGLIIYSPDWLFGIRNNGYDLRSGPGIWLALVVAVFIFVLARHWLSRRFWIETAIVDPPDLAKGLGFRLDEPAISTVSVQAQGLRTPAA
ncbi:MAG: CPBP family glutamic-type intramembrane protease [Rhizobiaceae bacterium]